MIATTEQNITLEVLKPEHIVGATRCIVDTFAKGEPMTVALGITPEEYTYFAQIFIEKAAVDQMSAVAVDDWGKVVGATICEDYTSAPPVGIKQISEKFTSIFQLLESLSERYTQAYRVVPGSHYHIFMCGVSQSHANLQLGQKLTRFVEDLAREYGYHTLICEATGRISQFVTEHQLGFQHIDEISYQQFQYKNQPVFSSVDNVKSCAVYHKAL